MMCVMHQAEPYGYLVVNGNAIDNAKLARMVGAKVGEVARWIDELETAGVPSRDENGVIFSRRMVRDEALRKVRAAGGKLGGNPALKDKAKVDNKVNLPAKLAPTPSSSVLQSSASGGSNEVAASNNASTGEGRIARALRDKGVKGVTPSHPTVVRWAKGSVPENILLDAVTLAREQKPAPELIPFGYLEPIVERLRAQLAQAPRSVQSLEWWLSDSGIRAKATELGVDYTDPVATKCRIAARLGDGPWVDHRNATELRLIEEYRAAA